MADQHLRDGSRKERLGFDESVYCAGKSAAQIERIVAEAIDVGDPLLLTRLGAEQLAALPSAHRAAIDYDEVSRTGVIGNTDVTSGEPAIAIVTAGTSDVPVGREAVRTLAYLGLPALEVYDVGVAGLWRLLERVDELRRMRVVIVAAGMDAALPSVIGGQVPGAVIAVPTSVGYGVAAGGETALRAVLASCAPGVLVVNIDNGYGAACAAFRIVNAAGAADT